ncbi:MAG: polyprenyl synthetase family protein [Bacteroidetes bacterium]|nr:polyprenyl synthetase family protein [Bacteroidota bacterium]
MQTLHQFQTTFEQYLAENEFSRPPIELYGPVDYIFSLGGKRLRPTMLLLGHFLFDENFEKSLPAAFAIEVFHNFTLVHDDIMDAAPLRRGKPTVHVKYGLNAGILSGDVMLVLAYDYLMKVQSSRLPEVIRIFTRTATEVCEGQQMDMNFETRQDVSIEEYLKMIELKTSVLVAGALEMGALLGGASADDARLLYEFGRNLGIAFQLQDDLLDAFGNPLKFGKKTGGDIAQNKKTWLYLKALEAATPTLADTLRSLYSSPAMDEAGKIEQVLTIFNQLNIKDLAEEKKEKFRLAAIGALAHLNAAEAKKNMLENFANALMNREM